MKFDYSLQPGKFLYKRDLVRDGTPLVTIVTPFYNGAEYFLQTYHCVLNQTFPWFEWIIVNDGSTNKNDVEFIENLAKNDPRISVVHKTNGGISTARNFGMRQAKTKYVVSLDCDDLIEPQYLEYCWWMLEKNPEAAWAYTDSVGFQNQEYTWKKKFDPILLKTENHLTEVAFIRKSDYDEIGGYAEVAKHYNEDWYFYLRMVAKGKFPVQSKNDFLSWYRRRDNGVLSIVDSDSNIKNFNSKLIQSMAENIISPKKPIIFPINKFYFDKPKLSDWDRSIYAKHSKVHVLLITAWLEMGGADKFNLDLISGLSKDKYEVSVITTVPSDDEPWQQRFRDVTPEVFNLPNFMEPQDYPEFVSYFIKSRQIDILLVTNSYHGYYMMPWLRKNFPSLIMIDYLHMEEWNWRKGGYARTAEVMRKYSEKTYVCNSNTKDVLSKEFNYDNVEVIHIGVDSNKFDREWVRPGIVYETLKIDKNRPIVLFICRLCAQKRPMLMLEIAKRVKERIPEVAFVVVGSGELEEKMQRKADSLSLTDTVYFAGAHKEIRPFYRDAKLTLICSIKEGLSLSAYESCSMGVPVISSDVGGQKDLIDESVGSLIPTSQKENTEYYSENYNVNEVNLFVNSIEQYLTDDDKWKKASVNAIERVRKFFSIKNMIDRFDNLFSDLIKDNSSQQDRKSLSDALRLLDPIADDYLSLEFTQQTSEEENNIKYYMHFREDACQGTNNATSTVYNQQLQEIDDRLSGLAYSVQEHTIVLNRHEEVVNRHEEVVNRHEEVVNRHEEVVNRHEEVVNRHEVEINKHNAKIDSHYDYLRMLDKRLNS